MSATVPKLGIAQRDSRWLDRLHRVWEWDDWAGWQMILPDGARWGSFQNVEGEGPFTAVSDD